MQRSLAFSQAVRCRLANVQPAPPPPAFPALPAIPEENDVDDGSDGSSNYFDIGYATSSDTEEASGQDGWSKEALRIFLDKVQGK